MSLVDDDDSNLILNPAQKRGLPIAEGEEGSDLSKSMSSNALGSSNSQESHPAKPVCFIDLSTQPTSIYNEIGPQKFETIMNLFDKETKDAMLADKIKQSANLDEITGIQMISIKELICLVFKDADSQITSNFYYQRQL